MTNMPGPGTMGAPYFDGQNITDFLNRYEDLCYDFRLSEAEKVRRLPRYCEIIIAQSIEIIEHWIKRDWTRLRKTLLEEYKQNDIAQEMHSRRFLEAYKNKHRDPSDDIRQYCRRFRAVSDNLFKAKKIDETTRVTWFIQGLPHVIQEQLALRYDLDLDPDQMNKLDFKLLVDRALLMAKTARKLKEIRNTGKKGERLSELIQQCDDSETHVLEHKDPYRLGASHVEILAMDRRREVEHNRRMDEVTKQMEAMALAMRAVVPTSSPVSPGAQSTSQTGYPSRQRVSSDQCLYCESSSHNRRKDCEAFIGDVRSGRIHLNQEYKICLGPPDPNATPIVMRNNMSQQENVKVAIADRQSGQINVRTVRVGDWEPDELSTDEEDGEESDFEVEISPSILVQSARTEGHKFGQPWQGNKGVKKTSTEQKYAVPKTVRFGDWVDEKNAAQPTFMPAKKTYALSDQSKTGPNSFTPRSAYTETTPTHQKEDVTMKTRPRKLPIFHVQSIQS